MVGRDEGALALAAGEQVIGGEFVDRLAHGALADLKPRGELELARDRLARLPFATIKRLNDQILDLAIQRAERRAARTARGRDIAAAGKIRHGGTLLA